MFRSALVSLLLVLTWHPGFAEEKINVAVMELGGNNVETKDLKGLSSRLRSELFKTDKFQVIERGRMQDILKEQGFQQSGCSNAACAVEIGQLIGVSKIIVGSVDRVGKTYSVNIRLIDVQSGRVETTADNDCRACNLNDILLVTIHNVARILAGLPPR